LVQPLYGWVLSRYPRIVALPCVYAFFATTLIAFHAWFFLEADHTWLARVYFVWVSVFNLFVVAVFWSLMADVFNREQAGRLFGCIAAGLSLGGLIGPLLASLLAAPLGSIQLLLFAAGLLLVSAHLMRGVIRWHVVKPSAAAQSADGDAALHGSVFAAFPQVARSTYLRGVALFVFLLTAVTTLLYVDQQRVIAHAIRDTDARTVLFARIDFAVQALSLLAQLFLFSRLLRRFGFTAMLVSIPVLLLLAFSVTGLSSSFEVVIGTMMLRRIGEYAVTRPCRDMLMSVVSREEKYRAKSLIDTFVYRGGDALSASAITALTALATSPATVSAIAGAGLCAVWALSALWLGRRFEAGAGTPTVTLRPASGTRAASAKSA
jgi:AAA family ATP:ADP antiporter